MESKFVDRLPNFGIIAAAGFRDPKKTPRFLSTKEIICPKCGRMEYANVDQKRVVMCSLCLMSGSIAVEKNEYLQGPPLKKKAIRLKIRSMRICDRCGKGFRGKSNRQRFCENCQRGASNEKTVLRMKQMRKGSLVTV